MEQYQLAQRRIDHRFGTLAALTANVNRDPKKQPTPYTWEDFFPHSSAEADPLQTERETYATLQTWAVASQQIEKRRAKANGA